MKTVSAIMSSMSVVVLLPVGASAAGAAGLSVLGDCTATFGAQWGVGLDDKGGAVYLGSPGEVLVDVTGLVSGQAGWRLDVRREGGIWPRGMRLWVRRTGDGLGSGRLSGGMSFQEVTPNGMLLCLGTGDRLSVPLQLKITGVALGTPVGTYATAIGYTLVVLGE
jgi:hypothetical protein